MGSLSTGDELVRPSATNHHVYVEISLIDRDNFTEIDAMQHEVYSGISLEERDRWQDDGGALTADD